MLRSEEVRKLAPEMDPLRMGMGWKVDDLSKPQVMVESSYGDSHPGSAHLNIFVEEAVKAVDENGGKAARYFATVHQSMLPSTRHPAHESKTTETVVLSSKQSCGQ